MKKLNEFLSEKRDNYSTKAIVPIPNSTSGPEGEPIPNVSLPNQSIPNKLTLPKFVERRFLTHVFRFKKPQRKWYKVNENES